MLHIASAVHTTTIQEDALLSRRSALEQRARETFVDLSKLGGMMAGRCVTVEMFFDVAADERAEFGRVHFPSDADGEQFDVVVVVVIVAVVSAGGDDVLHIAAELDLLRRPQGRFEIARRSVGDVNSHLPSPFRRRRRSTFTGDGRVEFADHRREELGGRSRRRADARERVEEDGHVRDVTEGETIGVGTGVDELDASSTGAATHIVVQQAQLGSQSTHEIPEVRRNSALLTVALRVDDEDDIQQWAF